MGSMVLGTLEVPNKCLLNFSPSIILANLLIMLLNLDTIYEKPGTFLECRPLS